MCFRIKLSAVTLKPQRRNVMKMKKNISYGLTALLFAVIIALALALIGCGGDKDGGKPEPEPECDCTVKVHPAPCDCPAAGTPACDCTEEQPKAQHSPNVPMFADKTATITTNDTFTDTQWNAIVTAIVGKFTAAYEAVSDGSIRQAAIEEIFDLGVTIIVEKTPSGYTNYKTANKFQDFTLYVNANGVNNMDADTVFMAFMGSKDTVDGVTQP
jgi:hypothetical protein